MPDEFEPFSADQEKLHEILIKISNYQLSLREDRAVAIDELKQQGVLSSSDVDFMASHSVTYKPHKVSDYHASDMLQMPTKSGCVFLGPCGPALKKRRAGLKEVPSVIQGF